MREQAPVNIPVASGTNLGQIATRAATSPNRESGHIQWRTGLENPWRCWSPIEREQTPDGTERVPNLSQSELTKLPDPALVRHPGKEGVASSSPKSPWKQTCFWVLDLPLIDKYLGRRARLPRVGVPDHV